MYNIFMVTDKEDLKGDISLVEEIIECYTDDPSHFVGRCKELEIGEIATYSDHINDYVIVRKVA